MRWLLAENSSPEGFVNFCSLVGWMGGPTEQALGVVMADKTSNQPQPASLQQRRDSGSTPPLALAGRVSSLPPPPELEELDEGWGEPDEAVPLLTGGDEVGHVGAPGGAPNAGAAAALRDDPTTEGSEWLLSIERDATVRLLREDLAAARAANRSLAASLAATQPGILQPQEPGAGAEAVDEPDATPSSDSDDSDQYRERIDELERTVRELRAEVEQLEGQLATARRDVERVTEAQRAVVPSSGDDLQQLRGIGPKLAAKLRALGITRFEQLAELGPDDLDELAPRLGISRARIERDGWIEAAQEIATRPAS